MAETKKPGAVLRNTVILVGGQLAGVPLSVLLSAAMGRYLGATEFGYVYLATTFAGFGFLLVEWGHGGVIAAAVARDHARARHLLGTTLAWRTAMTLLVSAGLLLVAVLLGYPLLFQLVLALTAFGAFLNTLRAAYQDIARGFERLDVSAYAQLGFQLLSALIVIPTLLLGGKVLAVLVGQAVCGLLVMLWVWRSVRAIDRQAPTGDSASLKELFTLGTSFLVFNFVLVLQPNVDAIFLSKLTSPAVLGWYAAAQRLIGFIIMPVSALGAALYPTLSRLWVEDRTEYQVTVRRALQGTSLLAIPAALGCALYRAVGVKLYGEQSFEAVQQNLLVASALVFLLYFSMPIGIAILAAGRQRAFAIVQSSCIVVSVVLDPILVPWFQRRYGNGALGVNTAAVCSEVVVLAAALPLVPKGVLNLELFKSLLRGVLAGCGMTGVALVLRGVTPYVSAPLAVLAYFGCLWLVGGIAPEHVQAVRGLVARKFGRRMQA